MCLEYEESSHNELDLTVFHWGADILDNARELVGALDSVEGQVDYLITVKGIFFTKGIILPLSAVNHVSDKGIHLNLRKDELGDSRFETPPTVPGNVW